MIGASFMKKLKNEVYSREFTPVKQSGSRMYTKI